MHWRPYQQVAGHFASGHCRWASRSVDEAIETLASPDVTVTNQGDKDTQRAKLATLDGVREVCELGWLYEKVQAFAPGHQAGLYQIGLV